MMPDHVIDSSILAPAHQPGIMVYKKTGAGLTAKIAFQRLLKVTVVPWVKDYLRFMACKVLSL